MKIFWKIVELIFGWKKREKGKKEKPTPPPAPAPDADIPHGTIWLHTDVSKWPIVSPLHVSFDRNLITVNYNAANVWPVVLVSGEPCVGNVWIFIQQHGKWYAATWEWLKRGQIQKLRESCNGKHIKRPPLENWEPTRGERYKIMVSGLARDHRRNVKARTRCVEVRWP